jgi:hypothetical protein
VAQAVELNVLPLMTCCACASNMTMEANKADTSAAPADKGGLSSVFIAFIRSIAFNKFRWRGEPENSSTNQAACTESTMARTGCRCRISDLETLCGQTLAQPCFHEVHSEKGIPELSSTAGRQALCQACRQSDPSNQAGECGHPGSAMDCAGRLWKTICKCHAGHRRFQCIDVRRA